MSNDAPVEKNEASEAKAQKAEMLHALAEIRDSKCGLEDRFKRLIDLIIDGLPQ